MGDTMNYSFSGELTDTEGDEMKTWLAETWRTLDDEEAEQDFLDYIMVMIKTQKTMKEIQSELNELGVDDSKSR